MTTRICAVLLLSLALTACESANTDNANTNAGANTNSRAATPPATPAPQASPSASAELKAGDKVKVNISGVTSDATVIAVDQKAGKATVRIQGQKEDKKGAISDVAKS